MAAVACRLLRRNDLSFRQVLARVGDKPRLATGGAEVIHVAVVRRLMRRSVGDRHPADGILERCSGRSAAFVIALALSVTIARGIVRMVTLLVTLIVAMTMTSMVAMTVRLHRHHSPLMLRHATAADGPSRGPSITASFRSS
jgi:hypothetical protein